MNLYKVEPLSATDATSITCDGCTLPGLRREAWMDATGAYYCPPCASAQGAPVELAAPEDNELIVCRRAAARGDESARTFLRKLAAFRSGLPALIAELKRPRCIDCREPLELGGNICGTCAIIRLDNL